MIGYRMPTRVCIEEGCLERLPEVLTKLDSRRALLVFDPGLAATTWPARTVALCEGQKIALASFDAVEPNPRTTTATLAALAARDHHADIVIGLGGGSVLDTAKAAAMLVTNPGSAEDYVGANRYSQRPLPMIAIPTTCGTGSEVTWVSVLSDQERGTKISVKGETMFPDQALVDADLIATLPRTLVAWTGADALTHALEAYTCQAANPVSDVLAVEAIRLLFEWLPRAVADIESDHRAREAVMRASTLAGLAFGNADVAGVHCLSESIGGLLDVAHGLTNAILLAPVLRSHAAAIEPRLEALDQLVSHGRPDAERFLRSLESLLDRIDIPSFDHLRIEPRHFPQIARNAVANGSNASNPRVMHEADYLDILSGLATEDSHRR